MKKILFGLMAATVLLICSASVAQTYSAEDVEKAHEAATLYKQKYWDCLAGQQQQMLGTNITLSDFKVYLQGTCLTEKQNFRVPFVDYLAMKFPEMGVQDHMSQFDYVAQAAIDYTVTGFVQARNSK